MIDIGINIFSTEISILIIIIIAMVILTFYTISIYFTFKAYIEYKYDTYIAISNNYDIL